MKIFVQPKNLAKSQAVVATEPPAPKESLEILFSNNFPSGYNAEQK